MSLNNIDVLLGVLGNETRRKILQLLADEPRYFIQLSRDLGVSQQAVLKHLEILERNGFVTSHEEESSFPAPKRKYFELNMSCMLAVGITSDAVEFVFQDIPKREVASEVEEKELRSIRHQIDELENESDPIVLLNQSDSLLKKINSRLKVLLDLEIFLLRMRQRITKVAHEAIRSSFNEELHRHILYSTIGEEKQPDVDELSSMLDIREKEISEALKILKQRRFNSRDPGRGRATSQ